MENVIQVRNEYRRQQWTQIIRECQSSGLSNREYCRQHGISEKKYYYWLRKLRSAAAESMPQIVEMEPPAIEDKVYIRFRGAELALPAETDVEAIAAVLRSLQQLPYTRPLSRSPATGKTDKQIHPSSNGWAFQRIANQCQQLKGN